MPDHHDGSSAWRRVDGMAGEVRNEEVISGEVRKMRFSQYALSILESTVPTSDSRLFLIE